MSLSDNNRPAPRPGLLQRAAAAARYMISGVTPETWMSPLQPLRPMAESTKGRAFDFPVAWNLNYIPRATERVSFQRLKMLSTNWDLLRLIIERRKDQIEALDWTIRPKEQQGSRKGNRDAGSKHKPAIDEVTEFFKYPDKRHDWAQWIRSVLDQHMVYDGVAIYKRPTRGKKLWGLELQDAATIKILLDGDGRIPQAPSPAFQQVLKGLPTSNYTTYDGGEMMYVVQNVRPDHVYGYSRVEQIIWRVETAIQRVSSQLAYFTEGNIPDQLFIAPEGMTSDQIAALQTYWDGIFAGNVPIKRRGWWLPHGSDSKATKEKPLTDEFDEWLARVACYAFSVSPQPFVQRMNRATAESAQETAESEGNAPTIKFVSRLVNRVIAEDFGHPELEFSFDLDEEFDPVKAAVMNSTYVRAGIKTIDEVRDDLGEETKGGAAATLLYATPTGFVPIDPTEAAALVAANRPPPPAGFGGAPTPGGTPKPGAPVVKPGAAAAAKPQSKGTKPQPKGSASVAKSIVRSLYVNRPLLNAHDLVDWAREQGFHADAINPDDLHVTLAYSTTPVDWSGIDAGEPLVLVEGDEDARSVAPLGDDGAIVLHLESDALRARWQALNDAGAVWNYPEYRPHVTITYDGHPDLSTVKPYTGQLIFGAEERSAIGEDGWAATEDEVDAAAAQADRNATPAQIASGNYGKGHVIIQGLDISIESEAGSMRRGTSPDGVPWEVEMPAHYGYVKRSLGADGEHVDVFLGPYPLSERAWIIDQINANTGAWDEHKVMLGYSNLTEAVNDYTKSFSDDRGFERIQDVTEVSIEQLKEWLTNGDSSEPLGTGWMTGKTVENFDPRSEARGKPAYLQRSAEVGKVAAVPFPRSTLLAPRSSGHGALTKVSAVPFSRWPEPLSKKFHPLTPNLHTRPALKAAASRLEGRVAVALKQAAGPIMVYIKGRLGKVAKAEDDEDAALAEALKSLQVLINATEDDLEEVAADGAREALATLGVEMTSDLVDQVNERAAKWAEERAGELVTMVTDSTRNMVRDVVASGLADGDRANDISERLEEVGFGEKRAHLIANTEVANANSHGALNGYVQAKENGVETLKEWLTDDEPCPICEENADAGPIPLEEDFPSGDDAPQAHPNCLCALVPWVADDTEESGDAEPEEE